jgi:hypothetical protein
VSSFGIAYPANTWLLGLVHGWEEVKFSRNLIRKRLSIEKIVTVFISFDADYMGALRVEKKSVPSKGMTIVNFA